MQTNMRRHLEGCRLHTIGVVSIYTAGDLGPPTTTTCCLCPFHDVMRRARRQTSLADNDTEDRLTLLKATRWRIPRHFPERPTRRRDLGLEEAPCDANPPADPLGKAWAKCRTGTAATSHNMPQCDVMPDSVDTMVPAQVGSCEVPVAAASPVES